MSSRKWVLLTTVGLVIGAGYVIGRAKADPPAGGQERKVKEAEVPKVALAALKKQAGANAITEYSEEIEHGCKYYEGSWKGPNGHVDVLVTEAGDLVEIEEGVGIDTLPKAVVDAARKAAGKDAALRCEKKTSVTYEVKFVTGKTRHELLMTPDGRTAEHEKAEGDEAGDEN